MKNMLAILALALAAPGYAGTTCTGTVSQIAVDLGGEQRVFVVMHQGPTLSLLPQGDAYKVAFSMASLSQTIGQPLTAVFAGEFNCANGGIRKDVLRVQVGDEGTRRGVN
jgi:hypothetical protein